MHLEKWFNVRAFIHRELFPTIKRETSYKVYVENYVLATNDDRYLDLDAGTISYFQSIGELPTPLPKYQLNAFQMLWGNALWIVIAYFVIATGISYRHTLSIKACIHCFDSTRAGTNRRSSLNL